MNQQQYIIQEDVQSFIRWVNSKSIPNSFIHQYFHKNSRKDWTCNSIFNAFENYDWPFKAFNPVTKQTVVGRSFKESTEYLDQVSIGLRQAIKANDQHLAMQYCEAVLAWGGVLAGNRKRLDVVAGGNAVIPCLKEAQEILNPAMFDSNDNLKGIHLNSGFSKIYSLIIDDFVIYDGRVGAALGLLVRMFHEDTGRQTIGSELSFYYGIKKGESGAESTRNPSKAPYTFKALNTNVPTYIYNNMKANWLIKAIAHHPDSAFRTLPAQECMRALEAALFMVGYRVW